MASRSGVALLVTVALAACQQDVPVQPSRLSVGNSALLRSDGAIPRDKEFADSIEAVRIPDEMNSFGGLADEELIEEVRKAEGVVVIGLKQPGVARTSVSRVLPAQSKAALIASRRRLQAAGVKILASLRNIGAVVALIDPEMAPTIRDLDVVNYVSANKTGSALQGGSTTVQDTSWGVHMVGVDSIWNVLGIRSAGTVDVSILDAGILEAQLHDPSLDGPANLVNCTYIAEVANTCYASWHHGSFVAGIINARDNSAGYIGVAPYIQNFNSVRIFNANDMWTAAAAVEALDWVMGYVYYFGPRHVVNMSIGMCFDVPALAEAITRAANAGVLLVGGVGNTPYNCSGYPPGLTGVMFPARYPQVIAVSGTLSDDSFATTGPCQLNGVHNGSRYGPETDISAPFWAYSIGSGTPFGGQYWRQDCGTSFATALVSGVAALIWGQNPGWTAQQVRARLLQSALDRGAAGTDPYFGAGRLSAFRAMHPPLAVSISGPTTIRQAGSNTWSAVVSGGSAPYTYRWEFKSRSGSWNVVGGNTSTYSRNITTSDAPTFYLRVTATSGNQIGAGETSVNVVILR